MTAAAGRPSSKLVVVKHESVETLPAFEGLMRRVHAYNDRLMLTEHVMSAGSVFPRHSHPEEQLAYLVSGRVRVTCDGESFEARQGDSFVIHGGVEHQVVALEDSVALDIFTPARLDYIDFVARRHPPEG